MWFLLPSASIMSSPYLFFSSLSQALHGWRDGIARQEDESTGYVLPNKALIEIGIANLFILLFCKARCVTLLTLLLLLFFCIQSKADAYRYCAFKKNSKIKISICWAQSRWHCIHHLECAWIFLCIWRNSWTTKEGTIRTGLLGWTSVDSIFHSFAGNAFKTAEF